MTDNKVRKLGRLPEGALDDYYIESFLDQPGNKSKAYLIAYERYCVDCKQQGIEPHNINKDYARQYAKVLHERLRDRIQSELYRLSEDDQSLGRSVLRDLAKNATSESVQATCASQLAKGLYPDIQITKQESIEDIDQELKQLEQQINTATRLN